MKAIELKAASKLLHGRARTACWLDCAEPWSQVLRELSGLPAAVIVNRKDGTPKKSSVARRPAKLL